MRASVGREGGHKGGSTRSIGTRVYVSWRVAYGPAIVPWCLSLCAGGRAAWPAGGSRSGPGAWVAAGGLDGGGAKWARQPMAVAGRRGRAGRWPAASLSARHCVVDGRAGGQGDVQVGQQGAHVQGVGVPDEDLSEDRGIRGKQGALPEAGEGGRRGGGGCSQPATMGRTRRERGAAPGEGLGEWDHGKAVQC